MKKAYRLAVFLPLILYSQESGFGFYSGSLNFKPLTANTFEPRVGLIWHSTDNRLRLDIGNSIDLLQYVYASPKRLLTIGSDFFTYTLLRGESNFHFPVDAVDYLFGFNANYRDSLNSGIFTARLRLSHISAHFVDGHYDNATAAWKDNLSPRVYSKEFFDLTVSFEPDEMLRAYLGAIYVWHIDPTTAPKTIAYIGSEVHHRMITATNIYAAYQLTVSGLHPLHQIHLGVKIGEWYGRGTQVFFVYHTGNSIHGEYYDRQDNYTGFGFNIHF
jgi:hypothetical protein